MGRRAATVAYENRRKERKRARAAPPSPPAGCGCPHLGAYGDSVKTHLAKMGSPDPAHDLKHSDHFIQRCQGGGVDASVCAAIIYGAVHHHHPPSSHMTEEARNRHLFDSHDRRALGAAMHHWHVSQSDPMYAVGSYYYTGMKYPDKAKVEAALVEAEHLLRQQRRAASPETRELLDILDGLEHFLETDYAKSGSETLEANDSSTSCKPFTRLERDPERFNDCMARAKQVGNIINAKRAFELVRGDIEKLDEEHFFVLCFDFRGQLRSYTEVAVGQRHRVQAEPEDILGPILASRPDIVVLVHNHPSGDPAPSEADEKLTRDVFEAMKTSCPSIMLGDHIIVGSGGRYTSFLEKGLMPS